MVEGREVVVERRAVEASEPGWGGRLCPCRRRRRQAAAGRAAAAARPAGGRAVRARLHRPSPTARSHRPTRPARPLAGTPPISSPHTRTHAELVEGPLSDPASSRSPRSPPTVVPSPSSPSTNPSRSFAPSHPSPPPTAMEADAPPGSPSSQWRFAQCFGDKGEVEDITEGQSRPCSARSRSLLRSSSLAPLTVLPPSLALPSSSPSFCALSSSTHAEPSERESRQARAATPWRALGPRRRRSLGPQLPSRASCTLVEEGDADGHGPSPVVHAAVGLVLLGTTANTLGLC